MRFKAERWFPEGAEIREFPEACLVVGVVAANERGRPVALGYFGKAQRPAFNFSFRKAEEMERFIAEKIEAGKASEKWRAERLAERAAKMAAPNPLAVGDILHESWGYDQTNCNYYQVLELVGKRSVKIREIAARSIEGSGGFMSERVSPVPGAFLDRAEVMLRRVGPDGSVKIREWGSWARKCSASESHYSSWYA